MYLLNVVSCSVINIPPANTTRQIYSIWKNPPRADIETNPVLNNQMTKKSFRAGNYFAKDQINVNISLLKHFLLYQYREHISFCNMAPLLSQLYMVSFRNPSLNDLSSSLLVCSACQRRCVESVHIRSFAGLHSSIRTEWGDLLCKSPYSGRIRENGD